MYVSSSYILRRGSIWLIVHIDSKGTVSSVEDHDHYAGGLINPDKYETHEQLFIRRARDRGFSMLEIEDFLRNSKYKSLLLASKNRG